MKTALSRTAIASGASGWTPSRLVALGCSLETAYGAGVITAGKQGKTGWTTDQLVNMSNANSFL